jgi:hypothetical protein
MQDGSYLLTSLGHNPLTRKEVTYLTAWRAYDLAHQCAAARALTTQCAAAPADMASWHRNYTVNETFRTQDIRTFKEAHCEIKKCDVNTFAAIGGEFYITKPTASLDMAYHGDLGSTTKYTCDDVALSVKTAEFFMECVENQFYNVDDLRGVWRNA